jgi:hypothetical protein
MRRYTTALIMAVLTTTAATAAATQLPVPIIGQSQSNWCWAATGKMVMQYLGGGVSQCQQANDALFTSGCCQNPASCNQPSYPHWSTYNFSVSKTPFGAALTFGQLKAEIDANRPVAFEWRWIGGGGHIMVATGAFWDNYGSPYVIVNDPSPVGYGSQRIIPYSTYVLAYDHTHGQDHYNIRKN